MKNRFSWSDKVIDRDRYYRAIVFSFIIPFLMVVALNTVYGYIVLSVENVRHHAIQAISHWNKLDTSTRIRFTFHEKEKSRDEWLADVSTLDRTLDDLRRSKVGWLLGSATTERIERMYDAWLAIKDKLLEGDELFEHARETSMGKMLSAMSYSDLVRNAFTSPSEKTSEENQLWMLYRLQDNITNLKVSGDVLGKGLQGTSEAIAARTRLLWKSIGVATLIASTVIVLMALSSASYHTRTLQASEEKYRKLFNDLPDVFYRTDNTGRLVLVSPSFKKVLGYGAEEAIGMNVAKDIYQEPGRREVLLKELTEKGYVEGFEAALKHKNGTIVWASTNSRFYYNGSGKVLGVEGIFRDITERKKAEEAIRNSERKYRILMENIGIGVAMISPGMEILALNRKMKEWFPNVDIAKRTICYEAFNIPPRKDVCSYCPTCKTLKDGQVHESITSTPSGDKIVNYRVVSSPITNDEGKIIAAIEMVEDITSLKKAEDEKTELEIRLQRAEKMEAIGTLAGGVAHDLNNVLSGLVSYPDLILMDLPADSHLRQPILTIQDSGKKAAAIVQDLLTLARRGVAVSEVVNLNDVVEDYLKSPEHKRLRTGFPNAQFETDLQQDLLNVLGSPVHLSKTLMNLVTNAAESLREKGMVAITTKNQYIDTPIQGYDDIQEGDYAVLTVADNGVGIAEGDLKKIFEPFYTKKVMGRSGTGLGMAVVWGTVKDHNGYINIESRVGKGSSFSLYFPITRKQVDKTEPLSAEEYKGHGEKILIVDDVPQQREIASVLLKKLGYSVHTASSGDDAVAYMRENSVDLVILDMIMDPGLDGLDTYKKILESNPGQRAIIASGFSETDRVKEAQKLGAGAYLKKPYTMEKIGLAVKAALSRSFAHRSEKK